MKEVVKLCRAFLLSGQSYSNKPGNIAWENLCTSKHHGGLGIRNVVLCNITNMGKCVWVVATKQDNVWIQWISFVYLHNEEWWNYHPQSSAS